MDYRNLGRSGLKISPICLGTMMFGGQTDETTASRIISKAFDSGINFIDTADVYNRGPLRGSHGSRDRSEPPQVGARHKGRKSDGDRA